MCYCWIPNLCPMRHSTRDSLYIGQWLYKYFQGKIEVTIAGGRVVWENNELKVVPGTGKYIKMAPFSYLFDGLDKIDEIYLNSLQAPVKRAKSTT